MYCTCILDALRKRSDPNEVIGGLISALLFETTRHALVFEYTDIFSSEVEYIAVEDIHETCWTEVNLATKHSIISI